MKVTVCHKKWECDNQIQHHRSEKWFHNNKKWEYTNEMRPLYKIDISCTPVKFLALQKKFEYAGSIYDYLTPDCGTLISCTT